MVTLPQVWHPRLELQPETYLPGTSSSEYLAPACTGNPAEVVIGDVEIRIVQIYSVRGVRWLDLFAR